MKHALRSHEGGRMIEQKHCPLSDTQMCKVNGLECRYGLTYIHVPEHCPLPQVVTVERRPLGEEDDGIDSEDVILIDKQTESGDAARGELAQNVERLRNFLAARPTQGADDG